MDIDEFTAIINPPHAAILAVGAGVAKAIVKDGAVAVGTVMSVILSVDHRVIDGALGALRTVVKERPDMILINEGANTLDLARGDAGRRGRAASVSGLRAQGIGGDRQI